MARPRIPNYQVLEHLGEGGTAKVWLARRAHESRMCVLKVLKEERLKEAGGRARFLREAQVCSLLDHPNIARLYDAGIEDEVAYLAMEHIEGVHLEALMERVQTRELPQTALALNLSQRVLGALNYAHTLQDEDGQPLQIVHRDITPKNIMISREGQVKLIDFGIARINISSYQTDPDMLLGTPLYMSPEQVLGAEVDHRGDLYSWAAVLYALLTGRDVVQAATAQQALVSVVRDTPAPVSQLDPNLPPALDSIIAKALAKEPNARYQSARAFKHVLAELAQELTRVHETDLGKLVRDLFPELSHPISGITQPGIVEPDTLPEGAVVSKGNDWLDTEDLSGKKAVRLMGEQDAQKKREEFLRYIESSVPEPQVRSLKPQRAQRVDMRMVLLGIVIGIGVTLVLALVLYGLTN